MSLVSIIIPCYNYGWLLPETLDSVLAQTHQEWECIIIDDGSIDDTSTVVKQYQDLDSRFRYMHQANQGMSAARNSGLRLAQGNYIQFLDADDLLAPNKLKIQSLFLDNNITVDIAYGDVRYFRHGNREELSRSFNMQDIPWTVPLNGSGASILLQFIEINLVVTNSPLLRSSLTRRVGGFSVKMRAMEDWDFWVRCAAANAFFHYDERPDVWTLVRVHPGSTSQNHNKMITYVEKVREQLQPLLEKFGDKKIIRRNKSLLASVRLENARRNLVTGSICQGITGFWKLALTTNEYMHNFRSVLYWLKYRLVELVKPHE